MDTSPEVTDLARLLANFLAPFLPYLVAKVGDAVAEVTVEKSLEEVWERAKGLWDKLRLKVESKVAAKEAAEDVAREPENEDAQAAFRLQLKKVLAADSSLAAEVAQLWEEAKRASVTASAIAERSVAIGRDASGSIIITGDKNVLEQGKYDLNIRKAKGIAVGNDAALRVPRKAREDENEDGTHLRHDQ